MNNRALSLVVCTRNRPAAVRRLLEAVSLQTAPPGEVLIVDASDDSTTADVVAEAASGWGVGRLACVGVPPEHRGLTRQRNYGIDRAGGAIIAFLDDDTVPAGDYFEQILRCFDRHPGAGGVGGYILGPDWRSAGAGGTAAMNLFRMNGWVRREDYRWRLRRMFRLASPLPPGWMPPSGHGRPVSYLPPDGEDYDVEFVMGGASAWRRDVFERHRFAEHLAGYALYEDLEFCIRATRDTGLVLCTNARMEHYHDSGSRPDAFRYGTMVVQNGWYVWRLRWPEPARKDRVRWWATTLLLTSCRAGDSLRGGQGLPALTEAFGRCWGMLSLAFIKK